MIFDAITYHRVRDKEPIDAWLDDSLPGWRDLRVFKIEVEERPEFVYWSWPEESRRRDLEPHSATASRPFPLHALKTPPRGLEDTP